MLGDGSAGLGTTSSPDSTEPQEGSIGDTFRKVPKGHWRKARGSTHFPALAKVRQIIESPFLSFHFIDSPREDGEGWPAQGGGRWPPAPPGEGRGWSRTCHSIRCSLGSLGKEQRKTDKATDMLGTCVHKHTHTHTGKYLQ